MGDDLIKTGTAISMRLAKLEEERRRIGQEGLATLEHLDPEIASFVKRLWGDSDHAVNWFTHGVKSLQGRTPWQCIADGDRDEVLRILNSIAYGNFS